MSKHVSLLLQITSNSVFVSLLFVQKQRLRFGEGALGRALGQGARARRSAGRLGVGASGKAPRSRRFVALAGEASFSLHLQARTGFRLRRSDGTSRLPASSLYLAMAASYFLAREEDEKSLVRSRWELGECPMKHQCSRTSFKRASVWSYESDADCRWKLKQHFLNSAHHSEQIAASDIDRLVNEAVIVMQEEKWQEREDYRLQLERHQVATQKKGSEEEVRTRRGGDDDRSRRDGRGGDDGRSRRDGRDHRGGGGGGGRGALVERSDGRNAGGGGSSGGGSAGSGTLALKVRSRGSERDERDARTLRQERSRSPASVSSAGQASVSSARTKASAPAPPPRENSEFESLVVQRSEGLVIPFGKVKILRDSLTRTQFALNSAATACNNAAAQLRQEENIVREAKILIEAMML